MAERVALEIFLTSPNTRKITKELADLEVELLGINKAVREARKAGDKGAYEKLRAEQLALRNEATKLRSTLRKQQRDFRDIDFPEDSIQGLRREYRLLKRELDGLSASDPEFDKKARQAAQLSDQINSLNKRTGSYKDNIGRYEESVTSALEATQSLFSGGGGILGGGGGGTLSNLGAGLLGGAFGAAATLALGAADSIIQTSGAVKELNADVRTLAGVTRGAEGVITARAIAIADTFDQDVNEVLRTANQNAKAFGISFNDAFDLIEKGFLAGADLNGQFFDSLREYPDFFRELGGEAEQFVSILAQANIEGTYSDKAIDALKEFTIRTREFTTETEQAFNAIGIESEQVAKDIEEGGFLQVLRRVQGRLGELDEQSPVVGKALADIFSSAGEDAGLRFLRTVDLTSDALEDLIDKQDPYIQKQLRLLEVNRRAADSAVLLTESFGGAGSFFNTLGTQLKTFANVALANVAARVEAFTSQIRALFNSDVEAKSYLDILSENAAASAAAIEAAEKAQRESAEANNESNQSWEDWLEGVRKSRGESEKAVGVIGRLEQKVKDLNDELGRVETAEDFIDVSDQIAAAEFQLERQRIIFQRALDESRAQGMGIDLFGAAEGIPPGQVQNLKQYGREAIRKIAEGTFDEQEFLKQTIDTAFTELLGLNLEARGNEREQLIRDWKEDDEIVRQLAQKSIDQSVQQYKEGLDRIEERQRQMRETIQEINYDTAQAIGETFGELLGAQKKNFEETLKDLTIILLDNIEKQLLVYEVQILASQLASKGFGGLVAAGFLQGLVRGAFAAVKNQIRALAEGGEIQALADGGSIYPVSGQKITKRNTPPDRRGGDNALILGKVGEIVLNEQQQKRLQYMTGPDIFKRIGVPGFQAGGLISQPQSPPQLLQPLQNFPGINNPQFDVSLDPEILELQGEIIAGRTAAAIERAIESANRRAERLQQLRKSLSR